jgi:hypothetical protein
MTSYLTLEYPEKCRLIDVTMLLVSAMLAAYRPEAYRMPPGRKLLGAHGWEQGVGGPQQASDAAASA